MKAKKNYTELEFFKLRSITNEDLASNKPLVYMDNEFRCAESDWYVIYDTPNGKYVTVSLCDTSGIKTTKVFKRQYINANLRLAPDLEPERNTCYVNIFDDPSPLGIYLHSSVDGALSSGGKPMYVLPIDFVKDADGKWIVAPDQTTKVEPTVESLESKNEKLVTTLKNDARVLEGTWTLTGLHASCRESEADRKANPWEGWSGRADKRPDADNLPNGIKW